ncbi:MAG: hypothetical protein EBX37_16790 [Alphaproteobacteria bacterium]|nr:hypothetical protein [Alphaproteobacteria bacterium]
MRVVGGEERSVFIVFIVVIVECLRVVDDSTDREVGLVPSPNLDLQRIIERLLDQDMDGSDFRQGEQSIQHEMKDGMIPEGRQWKNLMTGIARISIKGIQIDIDHYRQINRLGKIV